LQRKDSEKVYIKHGIINVVTVETAQQAWTISSQDLNPARQIGTILFLVVDAAMLTKDQKT